MNKKFNIIQAIDVLPTFAQISVLYTVLGSLNSSAIGTAMQQVKQDWDRYERAKATPGVNSTIDVYSEVENQRREDEAGADHMESQGMEAQKRNRLSLIATVRAPLLAMFNAAQSKVPNKNGDPADFSYEESLKRQSERTFDPTQSVTGLDADYLELMRLGVVKATEIERADKIKFQDRQYEFREEMHNLILDKLNEAEPYELDATSWKDGENADDSNYSDFANDAFNELDEKFKHRLVDRMIPKLLDAKINNISRRNFDRDSAINVQLIAFSLKDCEDYVGVSEAEAKLAAVLAKRAPLAVAA